MAIMIIVPYIEFFYHLLAANLKQLYVTIYTKWGQLLENYSPVLTLFLLIALKGGTVLWTTYTQINTKNNYMCTYLFVCI